MKMKYVLYVPGLKKNLLSISTLEEKGFIVTFVYAQVLMRPRGRNIDDANVIGKQDGGLYRLKGQVERTMIHNTMNPCEL